MAGDLSGSDKIGSLTARGFFTPLRLGLFFAALYVSTGVSVPYMALWLKACQLTGVQIAVILALPLLARIVTGPLIAIWADSFRLRRTPILLMSAASAGCSGAMIVAHGFWPMLGLWFAASTLFGACSPLTDVIVLKRAAEDGFAYAAPRGIGSAAYVAANIAGGALLTPLGPKMIVIWITVAGLAAAFLAPMLLPPAEVSQSASGKPRQDRFSGVRALLRNRQFMLLIISAGLIQAAHGFYYSFSALTWRAQGLSTSLIGLLWGAGVGAEVAYLWLGEAWRRRAGPERLLILGGVGAVVRWTAYAFSPPIWLLFPLQTLHALSFTTTFIASLQLVERLSPPQSASAAQSLNAALYSGILIGLATLISGPLYERFGSFGYLGMALLAAGGLLGALQLRRVLIIGKRKPI